MRYNGDMRKASTTTSLRLTPEGKRLLQALAQKLGVTQAAIIEIAIRKFAETEKVYDPHPDHSLPPAQG
jgi:predicted DNA-binding protein